MAFELRPAIRENVSLIIGLAGGTGSGKTYSAMRLAAGIAGEKRFAVIDTEAGRAKHYADRFKFDHGDLSPPFTPAAYTEAIQEADRKGYPVIVVDSFSHEWAGDGGVLDMQEAELERFSKGEDGKREKNLMRSWIKPKGEHKKMMAKLLQVRAHLILCFRAEPKLEMIKKDGRTEVVPKESLIGLDGWIPIVEKNLPFETTAYFLLLAEAPGVPKPIKLQEQHRTLFPAGEPITEASGAAVAAWAAGGTAPGVITAAQVKELRRLCTEGNVAIESFLKAGKVERIEDLLASDYDVAVGWITKRAKSAAAPKGDGPEPIVDEAVAMRELEKTTDPALVSALLDRCKGQPWHGRLVKAAGEAR